MTVNTFVRVDETIFGSGIWPIGWNVRLDFRSHWALGFLAFLEGFLFSGLSNLVVRNVRTGSVPRASDSAIPIHINALDKSVRRLVALAGESVR
jgi:hypothetical protein